jgi:hypothetical protein
MAVLREPRLTEGMAEIVQAKKAGYPLDMEKFFAR